MRGGGLLVSWWGPGLVLGLGGGGREFEGREVGDWDRGVREWGEEGC